MSDVKLSKISLSGFKSIRELKEFEPKALNILIGPNGAGKSNFIAFFRFLSWMLGSSDGNLQRHVGELGGASCILFDGPEVTSELKAYLEIATTKGWNEYKFRLSYIAADTLIFVDESYRYSGRQFPNRNEWSFLGDGHREAAILHPETFDKEPNVIINLLRKLKVYQFHNTSPTSRIRSKWVIDDSRWLKEDGANLAVFLYRLSKDEPVYYNRIIKYIRLVIPFFDDFVFADEFGSMLLRWKEGGSDREFNASQASDGMLRTIALITLLSQPEKDLPAVMFIDEPELGLHPFAMDTISGLIKAASQHCQIFIATQSPHFIDYFEPEDIVVVDRKGRASEFKRLSSEQLNEWRDEYSLAEMWEKNILGGRP